jgi:DNA-binding Lrp family transcriptional regulator
MRFWALAQARQENLALADNLEDLLKTSVYNLWGEYDVILRFDAKTEAQVRSRLTEIGRMVGATATCLVLDPDERQDKGKRKPFAFVMFRVAPEELDNVLTMLRESEEVQTAEVVTGVYDIISEVAARDEAEFQSFMKRIWRSETARATKTTTMFVVKEL